MATKLDDPATSTEHDKYTVVFFLNVARALGVNVWVHAGASPARYMALIGTITLSES